MAPDAGIYRDIMGHHIKAIAAADDVAARICANFPQLSCVRMKQGFSLIPVDAAFVDATVQPQPSQFTEDFVLLTNGFREFLCELSRLGPLAYIETEYHGGSGAQGAAVYSDRKIVMEPQWSAQGPINAALKIIGVRRGLVGDQFTALGLQRFRFNDDLIEEAERQREIG